MSIKPSILALDENTHLICSTCGSQHTETDATQLGDCKICSDPRQYLPPDGQKWTSLQQLHEEEYMNEFTPLVPPGSEELPLEDASMISITTTPHFAISQRAILLRTPHGNVLWDCLSHLDAPTITQITALGGIRAICISHPHFYGSCVEWAKAFECPVVVAAEDAEWLQRPDKAVQPLPEGQAEQEIFPGVRFVKVGGHFPGSAILHLAPDLFHEGSPSSILVADSIGIVPNLTHPFSFLWSYPNMIPLHPDQVHKIWMAVAGLEFENVHGGWVGKDVWGGGVKAKVLDSAKQVIRVGWGLDHPIFAEEVEESRGEGKGKEVAKA
ncbi:hypothetical protein YB2330_004752 [Saitoella coloradoensis]